MTERCGVPQERVVERRRCAPLAASGRTEGLCINTAADCRGHMTPAPYLQWVPAKPLGVTSLTAIVSATRRVVDEVTITCASSYSDEISLTKAQDLVVMRRYARQTTGEKFLLRTQR